MPSIPTATNEPRSLRFEASRSDHLASAFRLRGGDGGIGGSCRRVGIVLARPPSALLLPGHRRPGEYEIMTSRRTPQMHVTCISDGQPRIRPTAELSMGRTRHPGRARRAQLGSVPARGPAPQRLRAPDASASGSAVSGGGRNTISAGRHPGERAETRRTTPDWPGTLHAVGWLRRSVRIRSRKDSCRTAVYRRVRSACWRSCCLHPIRWASTAPTPDLAVT